MVLLMLLVPILLIVFREVCISSDKFSAVFLGSALFASLFSFYMGLGTRVFLVIVFSLLLVGVTVFVLVYIHTLIGNNSEKEEARAETVLELFEKGADDEIVSYYSKLNKKDKKRIRSKVMDRVIYREKVGF